MWSCPFCDRNFVRSNQAHSCNDKSLSDFLDGKSQHTISLFYELVNQLQQIGETSIHPTKSMIALSAQKGFAYVTQLGKNFIDVVLPFNQLYQDNLCFIKIKQVPGTNDYNHYLRLFSTEDFNEEVKAFLQLAYRTGEC